MIKLNIKNRTASFDGKTVKEVLNEIREFSKDKNAEYLGDGFGNPNLKCGDNWGIYIDDVTYWGSWLTPNNLPHQKYSLTFDDKKVDKIEIDGGWYCFYDFRIYTKTETSLEDEETEDEETIVKRLMGY